MRDYIEIIESFKIKKVGTIYTVKGPYVLDMRIGDILTDIEGNVFTIKSIGTSSGGIRHQIPLKERPTEILLESKDNIDVVGDKLFYEPI